MFIPGTRYVLRAKAGAAPHRAGVAAAETKTFPSTIPVGRLLVSSGNNRNIAGLNDGVGADVTSAGAPGACSLVNFQTLISALGVDS